MHRFASAMFLLVTSITLGCAQYESPLSPLSEAKYNEKLFGSWHTRELDKDGKVQHFYLHIGPTDKKATENDLDRNYYLLGDKGTPKPLELHNMTRVVSVSVKADHVVEQLSFLVYPSQIEENHYVNAPLIMDGKVVSYAIIKYRLDGDKLFVWGEAQEEALKKLTEEGRITRGSDGQTVGDNTEALRKLFREFDTVLFPPNEAAMFERINAE